MSQKAFIFLTIITIFLIIFAKYNSKELSKRTVPINSQLLNFEIEKVKIIKISSKDISLFFIKKDNEWLCQSKYNYRANTKKINELIIKLSQLESSQKITANSNYFSNLSVSGENALKIELEDENKNPVSSISIGKMRENNNSKYNDEAGQYVMPLNEKICYLILNPINISKDTTDWLDNSLLNIKKNEINSISFLQSPSFKILNTDKNTNKFSIEPLKPDHKEKSFDIEQTIGIFENFSFSDIFPVSDYKESTQKFSKIITIKTFENINYDISLFEENNKALIKITSTSDNDSLKNKININNIKFANWIYELDSWTLSYLKKSYNDFIQTEKLPESSIDDDNPINTDNINLNEESHIENSSSKPALG